MSIQGYFVARVTTIARFSRLNIGYESVKRTCRFRGAGEPGMSRNEQGILHFLRVVSGNRVTLPEDVRRELKIKEGDYLRAQVNVEDREIVLSPAE